MEESGDIVVYQQDTLKGPQFRIAPKRPADLRRFSAEQISIVDQVIEKLKDRDAEEVSDLSHFFVGWKMVPDREDIPYETVFIRDPKDIMVTQRHRRIAEEMANENAL